MVTSLFPVEGASAKTSTARQEEVPPRVAEASTASQGREALLRQSDSRVVLGGRVAEFSYDPRLDRIVVRVMSGDGASREVVRQIPSQEYVNFISRFREMLGVLLNETF